MTAVVAAPGCSSGESGAVDPGDEGPPEQMVPPENTAAPPAVAR
ncbi:hypothetical protein [Alienimonas sp. DA493]